MSTVNDLDPQDPQDLDTLIRARLQTLAPESIQIDNESALHAGHPGAASGGGHYRLAITSAAFAGRSRIERHRLIHARLGDLMSHRIHALAIAARAPGEPDSAGAISAATKK